jgi:hypothetical protein
MLDFIRGRFSHQFNSLRRSWCESQGLPFTDILSADRLQRVLDEEGVHFRDGLFTPLVTLWAFLGQVFSPDHSCREAVARLIAFLIGQGRRPCAAGTAAYCKARKRLPEKLLARLVRDSGRQLHERVSADSLGIAGRRVYVIDGTTVSMPDTAANQKVFPQSRSQKTGVGFPIARVLGLFSLASGAVLDMAVGPFKGKDASEVALFHRVRPQLMPNSVVLGDRYFCSYWTLALLINQDIHSVFRLHQLRKVDFRTGQHLGPNDQIVVWHRPQRPKWMTADEYDGLPDELAVRQVRVRIQQVGFRVRELVVATTIVDPQEASAEQLASLFRARWQVELNLRSLKSVLGMDVLRCKTPEMVRKELWMHLLVYNLVREVMAQAACKAGLEPQQVSFKGALQTLNRFQEILGSTPPDQVYVVYDSMLRVIVTHRVANRPDRYEPRAVKRRAKPHDLLTMPRHEARKRLARKR